MSCVGKVTNRTEPTAMEPAERTIRLHDGDAMFYFRDLTILGNFIKTLGEAGVRSKSVVIESVNMSNECWDRLPVIDPDNI